jgi:hypothetical protein
VAIEFGTGERYASTTGVPAQSGATICFWVNPSAITGGYRPFFGWGRSSDGAEVCIIETDSNNIRFYWWNTSSQGPVNLIAPTANTWYFIAITSNGTASGSLTLRARAIGGTSWTTASSNSASASITANVLRLNDDTYGSGSGITYRYANFKAWDAVLTENELLQEMFSYYPVRSQNLNRWTPLIDTATDTLDFSGSARNWTITGTEALYVPHPPTNDDLPDAARGYYAAGAAGLSGTLAVTLGALTLAGTGALRIDGTLAVTLAALTLAGTGELRIDATLGVTLGAATLAASGTLGQDVTGTLNVTLGAVQLAGTSALNIDGTLGVTLGALALGGSGVFGTVTDTLGRLRRTFSVFAPFQRIHL